MVLSVNRITDPKELSNIASTKPSKSDLYFNSSHDETAHKGKDGRNAFVKHPNTCPATPHHAASGAPSDLPHSDLPHTSEDQL